MSGNWPTVQQADEQLAALLDADQVINKPFALEELLDLVLISSVELRVG
jgi:hypothetical protein